VVGAEQFGDSFGMETASFEDDRFTEYESYEAALAAYEAEPTVRLLFESGAGEMQPGTPVFRFETQYDKWPPDEGEPIEWFATQDGQLTSAPAAENGAHSWQLDPEAGDKTFFGPSGYQLSRPLWDIDWTYFGAGQILAYETIAFDTSTIIAGPGIAELWVNSPVDDVTVQVTLTEVRPDGFETLIQSGWLRLGHRRATEGDNLRLARSYSEADYEPISVDTWVPASVTIPSVAHPIRAGSRLRMLISTPGRDHGTWEFSPPEFEDGNLPTYQLGYGPDRSTRLRMVTLPNIEIPQAYPPCPSLQGQPYKNYMPIENPTSP
jgi:predicted acyl esterase